MGYTEENMIEALDKFDKSYDYPVYASLTNLSGFFSSNKNVRSGYMAVTDNSIIIVSISLIGAITNDYDYLEIPKLTINKITGRKALLIESQIIDIFGTVGKKKYHYRLTVPSKVLGGSFPSQSDNYVGFVDRLQIWSKEV